MSDMNLADKQLYAESRQTLRTKMNLADGNVKFLKKWLQRRWCIMHVFLLAWRSFLFFIPLWVVIYIPALVIHRTTFPLNINKICRCTA